ncbi:Ribonuclease H domain [Forsythia ovata]|uniref:Ribonuclease H domain n=1 Tax=Forsythia ovata TaxID=205694 RepID=A0ABD1WDR5_9LAMI
MQDTSSTACHAVIEKYLQNIKSVLLGFLLLDIQSYPKGLFENECRCCFTELQRQWQRRYGVGVICRNQDGKIVAAFSKVLAGTFSLYLAECIAILEGLMFAGVDGLESNCINAVEAIVFLFGVKHRCLNFTMEKLKSYLVCMPFIGTEEKLADEFIEGLLGV